jgi:hypothetical protein
MDAGSLSRMHVYVVLFYGAYRSSSGVHDHEAEILFIIDDT